MDRKCLAGLVLLGLVLLLVVGVGCSDSGTPIGAIGSSSSTVGAPASGGAPFSLSVALGHWL